MFSVVENMLLKFHIGYLPHLIHGKSDNTYLYMLLFSFKIFKDKIYFTKLCEVKFEFVFARVCKVMFSITGIF